MSVPAPPDRRRRRTILIVAICAAVTLLVALTIVAVAASRGAPGVVVSPSVTTSASPSPTGEAPTPDLTASTRPTPFPTPSAPSSVDIALAQLSAIPIVSGRSDVPYDRDRFGPPWTDTDRNGCDSRNDILGRDLLEPVFKPGTNDCKVLRGVLIDPYDGQRVDFVYGGNTSVLVQIDHVVALAWAWRHGAEYWSDDQRLAIANDPLNLVAASERMNQEKSASGPGQWLPPVAALRCGYIENFVAVVAAYGLGINAEDERAARAVLSVC